MRRFTKSALALTGVAAAVGYSGFPTRVGLTKAQAAVSMPGDLLLPTAGVQADRAVSAHGEPRDLWPFVADLKTVYEGLYDIPLTAVYREGPDLVVWQGTRTIRDSRHEEDLLEVSVSVTLVPDSADSTFVHVRERYKTSSGRRGRIAALVEITTSAAVVGGMLAKMRRVSRTKKKNGK